MFLRPFLHPDGHPDLVLGKVFFYTMPKALSMKEGNGMRVHGEMIASHVVTLCVRERTLRSTLSADSKYSHQDAC